MAIAPPVMPAEKVVERVSILLPQIIDALNTVPAPIMRRKMYEEWPEASGLTPITAHVWSVLGSPVATEIVCVDEHTSPMSGDADERYTFLVVADQDVYGWRHKTADVDVMLQLAEHYSRARVDAYFLGSAPLHVQIRNENLDVIARQHASLESLEEDVV